MIPELFHIGNFGVPTYGVANLVAFLTAMVVGSHLTSRVIGVPFLRYLDFAFSFVVVGEIGARLTFLVVSAPRILDGEIPWAHLLVAGRVVLGGIVAAVLFGAWRATRLGLPVMLCVDGGLIGAALGMGIGRLGCLAAGCCYGAPTDLAWGITFTHPLAHDLMGTPLGTALHPTQIVQALTGLSLFVLLFLVFRRRPPVGLVTGLFLAVAGLSRLLVELLRADARGSLLGLATSQWIGLGMILAGLCILYLGVARRGWGRVPLRTRPSSASGALWLPAGPARAGKD